MRVYCGHSRHPSNHRRSICWALAIGLTGAAALADLSAGWAADGRPTLSFPYLTATESKSPGYRTLAERVAPSYVRVVIMNKGGGFITKKAVSSIRPAAR